MLSNRSFAIIFTCQTNPSFFNDVVKNIPAFAGPQLSLELTNAEQFEKGPQITLVEIGQNKKLEALSKDLLAFEKFKTELQKDVEELLKKYPDFAKLYFEAKSVMALGFNKKLLGLKLSGKATPLLCDLHNALMTLLNSEKYNLDIQLKFAEFTPFIAIAKCKNMRQSISDGVLTSINEKIHSTYMLLAESCFLSQRDGFFPNVLMQSVLSWNVATKMSPSPASLPAHHEHKHLPPAGPASRLFPYSAIDREMMRQHASVMSRVEVNTFDKCSYSMKIAGGKTSALETFITKHIKHEFGITESSRSNKGNRHVTMLTLRPTNIIDTVTIISMNRSCDNLTAEIRDLITRPLRVVDVTRLGLNNEFLALRLAQEGDGLRKCHEGLKNIMDGHQIFYGDLPLVLHVTIGVIDPYNYDPQPLIKTMQAELDSNPMELSVESLTLSVSKNQEAKHSSKKDQSTNELYRFEFVKPFVQSPAPARSSSGLFTPRSALAGSVSMSHVPNILGGNVHFPYRGE